MGDIHGTISSVVHMCTDDVQSHHAYTFSPTLRCYISQISSQCKMVLLSGPWFSFSGFFAVVVVVSLILFLFSMYYMKENMFDLAYFSYMV